MKFLSLSCLLWSVSAFAQTSPQKFRLLISLSGTYIVEQERNGGDAALRATSPLSLGYGDLRLKLEIPAQPKKFAVFVDGRFRMTGNFSSDAATVGQSQTTARGYLGGREYELRSAFFEYRWERFQFALGRLVIPEADALRLDGVRLRLPFAKKWDGNFYAGAYPNPYSRSLLTDYRGANGFYGASIVSGLSCNYVYDHYWGGLSLNGAYLGGKDDGGPLDLANPNGSPSVENGRIYATWFGYEKPVKALEFYHSAVFDFYGRGGLQLTRLDLIATIYAGRYVTLRTGYDHLSSIALEMFLTNLLANRPDFALANTITNNLIVARTARDEGRLYVDVHAGKLVVYAEGRVRFRSVVRGSENPQFVDANGSSPIARLAYDASFGLRDLGSLKNFRLSLGYAYWVDYRGRSHVIFTGIGRGFWQNRFHLDLSLLYARYRDGTAGAAACDAGVSTVPTIASLVAGCYGTRDGHSLETGLTASLGPIKRFFAFLDYRLVTNLTESKPVLLTHALLGRLEYRY